MPTEARGNYLPELPYIRETKTYHSQPLESIRHAGNYFVPLSIRPIFICCCCRSYVKLLDYWRAEKKFSLLPEASLRPEARGICHICHMVNPALNRSEVGGEKLELTCWNFVNVVNQFVVCSDRYVLLLVENFLTCSIFFIVSLQRR